MRELAHLVSAGLTVSLAAVLLVISQLHVASRASRDLAIFSPVGADFLSRHSRLKFIIPASI